MNGQQAQLKTIGGKIIATAIAAGTLLGATGCSNMTTTAVTAAATPRAAIAGRIHGGNQPVAFSTVSLYSAGVTGYGSAATLLATTTTANDGAGSFSFVQQASGGPYPNTGNQYTCPTGAGAEMDLYILAKGGNTQGTGDGGTTNSAATFLAPLGPCSLVSNSTFVDITEVTTAASVAALAQFINPSTEDIGTDGTFLAGQALTNAMGNVNNLVDQAAGEAKTSSTLAGSGNTAGVSAVTVTATPEAAKLNTIANIISTCVNQPTSSGNSCSTLFSNAVPPSSPALTSQPNSTFPVATDVLQAALYMYLNPEAGGGANLTNLYNLGPANGAPYQPTLTSAPTDWTVGVTYSASSNCDSSTTPFFSHPYDVNVDLSGNVWISNNSAASTSALVELSANGAPMTCVPFSGSSTAGGVVDINGNIWYTDSTSNVYRYKPSTATVLPYPASRGFTGTPLAITTDGSGNIFFSTVNGTGNAATGSVYEIGGGASQDGAAPISQIANNVGPNPARMFPDTAGDIWVTSGAGYVTQLATATSGSAYLNGYQSNQFTVPSPSYGITVGPANNVYVSSQDPAATLTVLAPTQGSYTLVANFPTNSNAGGLSNPAGIWLDGAKNSWIANNANETTSGQDALSVIAFSGTAVTPTGSTTGNSNGGYQKTAAYFNGLRNLTIDPAGNVWTTNDGIANGVTVVLGAAVPIVNPYSTGLQFAQQGRFQTLP